MRVRPEQLAALLAVVDHGTFEAGARSLSVTPSAVSQRIRALESAVGHVVVVRSVPVRTTPAGDVLLRMARQQRLLETDAAAELDGAQATRELAVAVNADSLATWFDGVLARCAAWDGMTLRLHVEDQDHSTALLRSGTVVGAVTSDAVAVQGCSVTRLGRMRYVPVATPALVAHHTRGGTLDWAHVPLVRFDPKDDLQHRVLAAQGLDDVRPPTHHVPSPTGFLAAVRAGLGWGAVPEEQLGDDVRAGRLVRLDAAPVDVPLHWQCWRLRSPAVDRLTAVVVEAAQRLGR